jgi:hypothetical protein
MQLPYWIILRRSRSGLTSKTLGTMWAGTDPHLPPGIQAVESTGNANKPGFRGAGVSPAVFPS